MSKVAILSTTPEQVITDYAQILDLIDYQDVLKKDIDTIIKINLSWSLFYPACSTPPWQLEGVIQKFIADGFDPAKIIPTENQTVYDCDMIRI